MKALENVFRKIGVFKKFLEDVLEGKVILLKCLKCGRIYALKAKHASLHFPATFTLIYTLTHKCPKCGGELFPIDVENLVWGSVET